MHKLSQALVLSCLIASPAAAQVLSVGPSVGYYRPFGRFDPAPIVSTDLPREPRSLAGRTWGAEARLTLRGRLGIEGSFSTVASTVPGCTCPNGYLNPTNERVNMFIITGQYSVTPPHGPIGLVVSAGPAAIQHGGTGYGRYGSPRSWGGAGGVEATGRLSSHLEAVARVTAVAYSFHLGFPPQSGNQVDGLLTLGARLRFGDQAAVR